VVRDVLIRVLQNPVYAYVIVFGLLAVLLLISLLLLRRIDVAAFRREDEEITFIEQTALAGEV
jgi:hypothetical protein